MYISHLFPQYSIVVDKPELPPWLLFGIKESSSRQAESVSRILRLSYQFRVIPFSGMDAVMAGAAPVSFGLLETAIGRLSPTLPSKVTRLALGRINAKL